MPARLLELPAEIRNRVYEYTLLFDQPLLLSGACKHSSDSCAVQPALTRVNKQIRSETLPMYYGQNEFAAHIHRSDFGYLIAFMDDIGLRNRRQIRYIKLHLKDRWTCGRGLLDFFRWCIRSEGTDNMWIDYTAHDWNMEHIEWMSEDERTDMIDQPDDYDKYMGTTLYAVDEALNLAKTMSSTGKTSERQIRMAWQAKLLEMSFDCKDCFAEAWNGVRGMGDDFRGYCTDRFKFADARTALSAGCRYY